MAAFDSRLRPVCPETAALFKKILRNIADADLMMRKLGTSDFGWHSAQLFGAVKDEKGAPRKVLRVAKRFSEALSTFGDETIEALQPKVLPAEALAQILRERLRESHLFNSVDIRVVENLTADAAAGRGYVKLKKAAKFAIKDADNLLYHEIFTHIVTTQNGEAQSIAKWLAFDSPRCTTTQEGLAVFLEIYAGKMYPRRLRKIVDRILCLQMIADGEHCGHMYDWLRERGYNHRDSLSLIIRAFRGIEPGARQPFTKDLTYLQGLINVYNFLKVNLGQSKHDRIEMLFAGKLALEDIPTLCRLKEKGVITAPQWIPPQFRNLDDLVTWFSCIAVFGSLDDEKLKTGFSRQS